MNVKKLLPILGIILFALPLVSEAQVFRGTSHWKSFRQELGIGTGASNYLGELGGRDRVGSDLFYDLEFSQTHTATSLFYRYYISEKTALRASASYAIVRGDDKTTAERFRRNRNLNFRSPIIEMALVYEVHLLQEVVGHRYNIKGAKGFRNAFFDLYLYTGLSGFYFNPKGQLGGGAWYKLRPLGTEGQGLVGGPDTYSTVSVAIPIGFGITKMLGKGPSKGDWKVGIDLGVRKTFTDYIDDVSTTYFDNDQLRAERSDIAAELADPSLQLLESTGAGLQRGDPTDKDSFVFALITVTKKMKKRPKFRRRVRSRRSMPSF